MPASVLKEGDFPEVSRSRYRPEVDGLRAIAVLPVLFYHAGYSVFSGGYVGVDVFFVISGFIITSLIVGQMRVGNFSFKTFYIRRAKRLFPCLFLMLFLSSIAAYFFLLPHQIKDFAQSLVATTSFLSNYFFYLETDYFNEFTNNAPLLHTWSLAVEEQFYFFLPLTLLVLTRVRRVFLYFVLGICLLVSFIFCISLVNSNPTLNFYSFHTRAWELLFGVLAALYIEKEDKVSSDRNSSSMGLIATVAVAVGLAFILVPVFSFDSLTPFPSWATLFPVVGTCLVLLYGKHDNFLTRILSTRSVVYIGLVSYSLYIFHQPIISFIKVIVSVDSFYSSNILKVLALVITVVISLLSYHCLEKPIRYGKRFSDSAIMASLVLILIGFGSAGLVGHFKNGFIEYYSLKFRESGGVSLVDKDLEKSLVKEYAEIAYLDGNTSFSELDGETKILLVGDSLARDTFLSLKKLADTEVPISVRILKADDECMDTLAIELVSNVVKHEYSECIDGEPSLKIAKELVRDSDVVIVAAKWQSHTVSNGKSFVDSIDSINSNTLRFVTGNVMFQDLTSLSFEFAKKGISTFDSKKMMYRNLRFDRRAVSDRLRESLDGIADVYWIEREEFFCERLKEECTLFDSEGKPRIWDNAHLTNRALLAHGSYIYNIVVQAL